ncbi:hypothetical protein ACIPYQ_38765 [Streptomyces sp. NPDC090045]|uniref:hypothetical protein n=1 Tax=Streptomyces sp. NPDC090045 TaxID=3365927 RepID=UPI0037F583A6
MERIDLLSSLLTSGTDTAPQALAELAAELDVPTADLLVLAGHPVPAELLPPQRDAKITEQFTYRVSHCDHAQLAALEDFVRSLPHLDAPGPFVQPAPRYYTPAESGLGAVFYGLLRNRGFGVKELPFAGLSRSTLFRMVSEWGPSPHRQYQLCAVAGPLGWRLPDLFAAIGEPYSPDLRPAHLCRHVGRVFTAAVPLTTTQLIECAQEADRLSAREDQGVWQPVSQGSVATCPDFA